MVTPHMYSRRLLLLALLISVSAAAAASAPPFELDGRTYVPIGESQDGSYTVRLSLAPPEGAEELAQFSVLFGADIAGAGYRLEADTGGWKLVSGGREGVKELASGKDQILPSRDAVDVLIKRRPWLLSIALNGRVVAEVMDDSHPAGIVAVDAGSCTPAIPPVVQAVSAIEFADSFTVAQDELDLAKSNVWRTERARWRLRSVSQDVDMVNVERLPDKRRPQAERSANPFSVSGFSEEWALLRAGEWFWDDYRATVSVRNRGAEAVGLAFNVRDADDLFLLRWNGAATGLGPTELELLRLRGETRQCLGKAWVNGQLGQWYNIGVRTCGTRIQALVDGSVVLDVRSGDSLGGAVGLYVEGGTEERPADFDDVEVRTIRRIDYTDSTWIKRHARALGGTWWAEPVVEPNMPAQLAPGLRSADGVLLLGDPSWPAPLLRVDLRAPVAGEKVGFLAGWGRSDEPHWEVTLGRSGSNLSVEITEQRAGLPVRLAFCEDVPLPDGDRVELWADFTREGEINVYVDQVLRLRAPRQASADGAPAVFGRGARGTTFRRLAVCFERQDDEERLPAQQVFRDDPFMKHWSSPQGAWWPVDGQKDTYWHVGEFYGRSDIDIPLDGRIMFVHAATDVATDGGYVLLREEVPGEQEGLYDVRLLRLGEKVAEARLNAEDAPERKLVLHKDGPYVWVTMAGRELLSFRDPAPLPSARAAVRGITPDGLAALNVRRNHVRDDYFERAPADWHSVGLWRVSNRFSCDPRWSHMAATTPSAAILFSKLQYEGDVTLEAFMGMRQKMGSIPYPRVGDLNLALTAGPLDLSSGYSFVLAGWDPFWSETASYLLRGTSRVASSNERLLPSGRRPGRTGRVFRVPWVSGGREIHGAWYYVKARKRGDTVSFYVDNHKICEFTDPEPLGRLSPAIWTYDNSIVVARAKVSYQKKRAVGRLVAPPLESAAEPAELPAPGLVSSTHPGFFDDFEGGNRGWTSYGEKHGGVPAVVLREDAPSQHSLKVTNAGAGGRFAVEAPVAKLGIKAADAPVLSFDYRIPGDVKINLYLEISGRWHVIGLSNPGGHDALCRNLGSIEVEADGRWHTAQFDLAAAYRELAREGGTASSLIRRAVFGNLRPGLLVAGFGGNPIGASYYLDNFRICSAGGDAFEAKLDASEASGAQVLVAIDRQPGTLPSDEGVPAGGGLDEGWWFYHARRRLEDGRLTPTAHLPFFVRSPVLRFASASPTDGAAWGYGPIRLRCEEGSVRDLRMDSVSLLVNGRNLPRTAGLIEPDWRANALVIDLAGAGVDIEDGQPCLIEVSYANPDGTGGEFQARYTSSLQDDTLPPSAVELVGFPAPDGFEEGLGLWQEGGEGEGRLVRDDRTAASDRWSLMAQNSAFGRSFIVYARQQGLDAGRTPIVEFDYRIHDAVELDWGGRSPGGEWTVGFTDSSGGQNRLGAVEGVQANGAWRHAEFNLLQMLMQAPYVPGRHKQQRLALADMGRHTCADGSYYHIDNFHLVPLVPGAVEIKWRARDASGIKGYSYLWSERPDDVPDDTVDCEEERTLFTDLPSRDAYLHVKACDRAGNWGPVTHHRFLVDGEPPLVSEYVPTDGGRSASSLTAFTVGDALSAVDPSSLKLTIDGRTYTADSRGVTFVPKTGRFSWDWVEGGPEGQTSVPDGKTIEVQVEAADFAENRTQPCRWSWVMDYSQDRQVPTLPVVACETMPILHLEDFQSGLGGWRRLKGSLPGFETTPRDEHTSDQCIKLTVAPGRGHAIVQAYEKPYEVETYPIISFDYSIGPSARVSLLLSVDGRSHTVQLTDVGPPSRPIGKLENVQADGKWRHASVNVELLLKKALPEAKNITITQVAFAARHGGREGGRIRLTRDAGGGGGIWMVDNFMIAGYGEKRAGFTWRSRDITGIRGYSVLFGQDAAAEPDTEITTTETGGAFPADAAGVHYLSVRACDRAGNWSYTRRAPYFVRPADQDSEDASEPPAGDQEAEPGAVGQ